MVMLKMANKTDNPCGKNNARRSLSFRRNKRDNKNEEQCNNNMNGRSILVRVKNGNKNHQEHLDSDPFLDNAYDFEDNDDVTLSANSLVSNSIKKPTSTAKAKKKLSKIRFFHKNKQKPKHKVEKEPERKNATWLPRCISVGQSKNRKISRLARPPNFILKKRKQTKEINKRKNKNKREKKGKSRRDLLRMGNHDSCGHSLLAMFISFFSCSSFLSDDENRHDHTTIVEKEPSSLHDVGHNDERTEPDSLEDSWCNWDELFCLNHTKQKDPIDDSETSLDEDDYYDEDDDDSTHVLEVPESITFLPQGSKSSHKSKNNSDDDHWNLIPVASNSLSSISESDSECSSASSDDHE